MLPVSGRARLTGQGRGFESLLPKHLENSGENRTPEEIKGTGDVTDLSYSHTRTPDTKSTTLSVVTAQAGRTEAEGPGSWPSPYSSCEKGLRSAVSRVDSWEAGSPHSGVDNTSSCLRTRLVHSPFLGLLGLPESCLHSHDQCRSQYNRHGDRTSRDH